MRTLRMSGAVSLFCCLCALSLGCQTQNLVSSGFSFLTKPAGVVDPYSWSFGGGVSYERAFAIKGFPVLAGARGQYFDARADQEEYGDSGMVMVGIYGGPVFRWPLDRTADFLLVPSIGYTQYWRAFRHLGGDYTASRPILTLGGTADVHLGKRMAFGLITEIGVILDQKPLIGLFQTLRIGYRF